MRVLIAAASFSSKLSGIQRHAFNVVRCLLHTKDISEVHLVISPWQQKLTESADLPLDPRLSIHVADLRQGSLRRNLWYYVGLPKLATHLGVDLVHLSYPVPINLVRFACPVVTTLHDLYPYEIPENFGHIKVLFNRFILKQCLKNADAIACVSDITRKQLKEKFNLQIWNKSLRIYNCIAPDSISPSSPSSFNINHPFLLSVAQHRHNKNIPLLIRTFGHMLNNNQLPSTMQLVVIGIRGPQTQEIFQLLSEKNLNKHIHLLEGLPETELQWCYQHCVALVTPSTTEGFGLPIAEAILAGCKVVCSDIPAHREIGEGHCNFFSLNGLAEKNLATAISAALYQPAQAPTPLPQYSPQVIGNDYIQLYRNLISPHSN